SGDFKQEKAALAVSLKRKRREDGICWKIVPLAYFCLMPKLWNPDRMIGFLEDRTPELTPVHAISPDRRPYSILGQRFMTTLIPAASARAAASSSRTVNCVQSTFGNGSSCSISSTIPATALEARKTSTMSIGTGISARLP